MYMHNYTDDESIQWMACKREIHVCTCTHVIVSKWSSTDFHIVTCALFPYFAKCQLVKMILLNNYTFFELYELECYELIITLHVYMYM